MTRQIGPRLGLGCDSKYCGDAMMDALSARHPLDDDVPVDELGRGECGSSIGRRRELTHSLPVSGQVIVFNTWTPSTTRRAKAAFDRVLTRAAPPDIY
jgi:hypothetical protein